MCLDRDFSDIMRQCFSSPTEYMKVSEEAQFSKEALRIAIEAKLQKELVYST